MSGEQQLAQLDLELTLTNLENERWMHQFTECLSLDEEQQCVFEHENLSSFLKTDGYNNLSDIGLRLDKLQYKLLVHHGVGEWNAWRSRFPEAEVWLSGAHLKHMDLTGVNLESCHLEYVDL